MNLTEQFKKYLLAEKSKPNGITIKNYLSDLRKFITWFENSKQKVFDPQSIEEIDIKNFQKYQLEKLSAISVKRILSSLRKFFTFLLNGKIITSNPFNQKNTEKIINSDPLLLHKFKNYLYISNSSHLTIKNYLIDIKQFIRWLEQTLPEDQKSANLIDFISSETIQEYKNRLIFQKVFSQSSINRKLSSLKKYYTWLNDQEIKNNIYGLETKNLDQNISSPFLSKDIENNLNTSPQFFTENEKNAYVKASYSKFPPLRLLQKIGKIALFMLDTLLITPTSELIKSSDFVFWRLKGKKIFAKNQALNKNARIDEQVFSHIPKSMYAPLKISTINFTPLQKLIYHLKYTRPDWYHKYHQKVLAHYFNLAILFIFASSIGVSLYAAFIQTPNSKGQLFAASPTAPQRVLSFQGRLTDNSDNPITSTTHIRFIIYNDPSASGSARLWEELDTATPDTNGIFSILLGSNGVGGNAALCNSGSPTTSPATNSCGIPQSLFADNPSLYLGVTIENTNELTPRQQIATVPYATNAEVLQGLAPTTDSSVTGNANVVLALNSSGILNIQGSSATTFQDSTGQFILSGNTLTLNSATGSNSNIQIAPDGLGTIDLRKPLINSTLNNNVTTAAGAVEVDDLFAVLATSSGQSAFTINQNGIGPVISASHSGTAIFTLDTSGNGIFNGNVNASTGNFTNLNISSNVTSNLNPSLTNTYSLGTSTSNQWLNLYAQNIYANGQLLTQLWQLNNGALSPLNISNDFLLGAISTGSAQFSVTGIAKNQAIASLSGNLIVMPNNGWGGSVGVGISTPLSSTALDIEKNSQGNATAVINQQGSGDIITASSSATTQFIVTNGGQIQARSFYDLDNNNFFLDPAATGTSLTVEGAVGIGTYTPLVSTALDIEKNASGNSALVVNQKGIGDIITASSSGTTKFTIQNSGAIKDSNYTTAGGIFFADSNGLFTQTAAGSTGQCLQSASGGTPTWGTCGGGTGYWTLSNPTSGALVPINNTLDVLIGGNATSSAKFGFLNVNSGTPTASISAGTNGALFIQANGNIQTTANQNITIGGTTSGNITLNPLNSTGTITLSGYTTGIIHSTNGVLSSSPVNLGNGDVTGTLGVGNGGTGNNSLATGSLFYGAGGNTALNPLTIGGNNSVLVSNGSLPSWTTSPIFGGNLTVDGNTTLGTNSSNTLTINASLNQTLLPSTNGTINLGSSSFYYGTIYADNIVSPVGNGTSGFWSLNGNTLYPVGTSYDLVIGGTSTASATFQVFAETVGTTTAGTASTSGNLVFHGNSASINLLNDNSLTFQESVGGDTGLSTIATLSTTGDFSINGNLTTTGGNINSIASTDNIFTTSASTINLGKSTTAVNIPGNITLGTSSSNTLAINSLVDSNIVPFINNTYYLGNNSNQWAGLYTHNVYLPVGGGTDGYWTMANNVIYPTYNWQDLAIGGTSTASAKFQIFANTVSGEPAGTASTSGQLTFNTGSQINLLNNSNLGFYNSVGGDGGITTSTPALYIANSGNVGIGTNNPSTSLDVHGGIYAINTAAKLAFNSTYSRNGLDFFGDGGITTTNNGNLYLIPNGTGAITAGSNTAPLSLSGLSIVRNSLGNATLLVNQLGLGDVFTASVSGSPVFTLANDGSIKNSLIPNLIGATGIDTLYNLGSPTAEWDTLYVRQIVTPPGGGIAGYWQLSSGGVLAPANLNNDLAIGGVSTSSAVFQVFANTVNGAPAGTATTSGQLSFKGSSQINILNGGNLGFYPSVGGDGGITTSTPALYIANNNNIGIGTNNPTSPLDININSSSTPDLLLGDGTNTANYISMSGGRAMVGYDGTQAALNSGSGHGLSLFVNGNGTFSSGTQALFINSSGFTGIGNTLQGNGELAVNQPNLSGDIFSASSSGITKFVVSNNGNVGIGTSTPATIFDVASQGSTFPSDLQLNQPSGTNLITNPSFEGNSSTGWVLAASTTVSTDRAIFGQDSLKLVGSASTNYYTYSNCITDSGGNNYGISEYTYLLSGYTGTPEVRVEQWTDSACTTGGTITTPVVGSSSTNQWERLSGTFVTGGTTRSLEIIFTNLIGSGGGTAYGDGFQLEQNASVTPYIDGSLGPGYYWTGTPNNSTSIRRSSSAFAYNTFNSANGIGAASTSNFPTLELDQNGTGNIISASSSGATEFKVSNTGIITASEFMDLQNTAYFLDPAATGTSLTTAGSVGIGTTSPGVKLDVNNGSDGDVIHVHGANTTQFGYWGYTYNGGSNPYTSFGCYTGSAFCNIALDSGGGNVGIGTSSPNKLLTINGDAAIWNAGELHFYTDSGSTERGNIGEGKNNDVTLASIPSGDTLRIGSSQNVSFWMDGNVFNNNSPGIIFANKAESLNTGWNSANSLSYFGKYSTSGRSINAAGSINSNGADYAEYFYQQQPGSLNKGDVVSLSPQGKAEKGIIGEIVLGIVSSNPGFVGNDLYDSNNPNNTALVGIVGQILTNVDTQNGTIAIGDGLTSSSTPGIAMKAYAGAPIIGYAEEPYSNNDSNIIGQITVYVNTNGYNPNLSLDSLGNIALIDNNINQNYTITHSYSLLDSLGNKIQTIQAFAQLIIGNLKVGSINAQQTITDSLAITTNNISIAGQSLNDYIISIVNNAISNGTLSQIGINSNIISPLAQVNHLATNIISPLASSSAIALRFDQNQISIFNDINATNSAVASIDNTGNATFSGTLNSKNLAVNGDATVSGTLYANTIKANSIEGLQEIVSTLSAQNITNVTNIFFATPSAIPATASGSELANLASTQSSQLTNNFTDVASYSGYLSYVPSLKALTGEFDQGLISLGATSLSDTNINGQLSLGSNFIFSQDSINVIGSDLTLQPLRQGGINFEGGLLAIDTSGNLTVNGNTTIKGILSANVISPLPNQDLSLKLPNIATTSATASISSQFLIKNSSDSPVIAFNNLGDIIASGAATVGKLNFNLIAPALAVSPTESIATSSAGTAQINVNQKSVTIDDPLVTENSLIYITPVGDSNNQTPFLLRQDPGVSFTVGLSLFTTQPVKFNWLIVN